MSAETKRREVLQMLAKGSISAAEAGELLEQIAAEADVPLAPEPPEPPAAPKPPEPPEPPSASGKKPRWLNVRVTDTISGRKKVSVKIPLSLALIGLRIGAKFAPEVEDMEWDEILSELASGDAQTIVEVQDEDDEELVQVYIS